jgi:hypothetical protein
VFSYGIFLSCNPLASADTHSRVFPLSKVIRCT